MSWNYRILRYGDGGYGLHEVYYDETGEPETWTLEPISFTCDEEDGPSGIFESLRMALADAEKRPVLPIKETWHEIAKEARDAWAGAPDIAAVRPRGRESLGTDDPATTLPDENSRDSAAIQVGKHD